MPASDIDQEKARLEHAISESEETWLEQSARLEALETSQ